MSESRSEGWWERTRLIERLPPILGNWNDRLDDYSAARLVTRRVISLGDFGTQTYYAPDTPERIEWILRFIEEERDLDAVKFRMWVVGIETNHRIVRRMLWDLFVRTRRHKRASKGRAISFEGDSVEETLDKAQEIQNSLKREFGRSDIKSNLTAALGNRARANFYLNSMIARIFGAEVSLTDLNPKGDEALYEDINALVVSVGQSLGVSDPPPSAEATREYLEDSSVLDVLNIRDTAKLIRNLDSDQVESLHRIVCLIQQTWAPAKIAIESMGIRWSKTFLEMSGDPTNVARDAASLLLFIVVLAHSFDLDVSDLEPHIVNVIHTLAVDGALIQVCDLMAMAYN